MSTLPISDEDLKKLVIQNAEHDADMTADEIDGLEEYQLYDIADNAWFYAGWMALENDPDLEDYIPELSDASERLGLSMLYQENFVRCLKVRQEG